MLIEIGDNIGRMLRALRKAASLSQDDMAEIQEVSKSTVSNWERNETDISVKGYLQYEEQARKALHDSEFEKLREKLSGSKGGRTL